MGCLARVSSPLHRTAPNRFGPPGRGRAPPSHRMARTQLARGRMAATRFHSPCFRARLGNQSDKLGREGSMGRKRKEALRAEPAAGNGILSRRFFLERTLAAGAAGLGASAAAAEPLAVPPWSREPGSDFTAYGQPSRFEGKVVRSWAAPANPATPGIGSSRTPHHLLDGTITPSGLHYERSHSGVPDIDPEQHRLLIHGLVRQPLVFSLEDLSRYPRVSRIAFIECAGNSGALYTAQAQPLNVQAIHGLLSCSDWTGVKLSTLLEEAGIDARAKWVLAEGADASGMSGSFPLAKALDDAMVCLYQNGERVRPANGYPVRLLLPGFEGNMNVKWLRRIKL